MRRFLLLAGLLLPVCAHASSITFTETATASGIFNGTVYTNALVTLTGTGDTGNVQHSGSIYQLTLSSATVSVAGVGTGTLTGNIQVVDNQGFPDAGFSDLTAGYGILFTGFQSAFSTYDLQSGLAATTGTALTSAYKNFGTTLGNLQINSGSYATFQATGGNSIAVTPEPSSLALLGTGMLAVAGLFRRRIMGRS